MLLVKLAGAFFNNYQSLSARKYEIAGAPWVQGSECFDILT